MQDFAWVLAFVAASRKPIVVLDSCDATTEMIVLRELVSREWAV